MQKKRGSVITETDLQSMKIGLKLTYLQKKIKKIFLKS